MKHVVLRGVLGVAGLCVAVLCVRADEIEAQARQGLDAYRDGHLLAALRDFSAATSAVQQRLAGEYRDLLPPAPAGWEADETEVHPVSLPGIGGGGLQISRRYFREEEEMALEVALDSPLTAGIALQLTDASLLASDPGTKSFRLGEYRGVLKRNGDDVEMSVLLGEHLLLHLSASSLSDENDAQRLLAAVDIAALRRRLQQ
ncbi:hypothetical protein [Plasticicumulans acidivorans]|uniref:Uncharacterized protein n=1 Tax=Plasticicumulans acidivorans TaxID=886464 RepID=A0A317N4Q4_9GAMM|nr:hypothetical protein [Plasticicumulans acidivorans]PWV65739.1 hypothetical protein C7443_101224 [Plasticicumulans acidivorans]